MKVMILHAALLSLGYQGKFAPVEAGRLVEQSSACLLVHPEKNSRKVTVNRVIWGSGLRAGERTLLKGYVFRDYVGGPSGGKQGDLMTYTVDARSIVFLRTRPRGVSLGPDERFALLPMIAFSGSRHACPHEFGLPARLSVGGVLFSPSMKISHPDSVSLEEVIRELNRLRTARSSRR